MRIRQDVANDLRGPAGVYEIIHNEHALSPSAADSDDAARHVLEHLQLALGDVRVACHADGLDQADAELARHDGCRNKAARRARARRDGIRPRKRETPFPAEVAAAAVGPAVAWGAIKPFRSVPLSP